MSILAWHDALALCHLKRQLTHEEKAAGWPPAMEIEVLTYMQRPLNLGNEESPELTQALYKAIKADCEKEAIPYGLKKRPVVIDRYCGDADFYPNEDLSDYVERTNPPKQTLIEDREFYTLTAAVFSSWLATNGRTPSVHIQEWFKSQGVALITESSSPPATPATGEGGVTTWPTLVQYRNQLVGMPSKQRPAWLPEHVAILAGRLNEEHRAGRGRGALGRLADELQSSTREGLRDSLKRHGYNPQSGAAESDEAITRQTVAPDAPLHGNKEKAW